MHIQCKLQGTVRSLHCSQNIHERQESDTREDEGGQHHYHVLHQPYGWDPFTPAIPPRISDVGVESREKHFDFSRTSSREDESKSRFTVPHESRQLTEWKLKKAVFKQVIAQLGHCNVDLFASRLTTQLSKYMSWKPNPGAIATDALSQPWDQMKGYAFPPFSLIGRCLDKVHREKVPEVVMIAPLWATQQSCYQ